MEFKELIKQIKAHKNCSSINELFEKLGGKDELGVSERNFNAYATGERIPPFIFLIRIFDKIPNNFKKESLLSYIESLMKNKKSNNREIINYLTKYLLPTFEISKENIWQTEKIMTYTKEQLDFLNKEENSDAFRFLNSLLVFEGRKKYTIQNCPLKQDALTKMKELELIEINNNEIQTKRKLYRIPSYDNSPPHLTSLGTDLTLNFLNQYISKEGSDNQVLKMTISIAPKDFVNSAMMNLAQYNNWIQANAAQEANSNEKEYAPFVFVGFFKELSETEV